MKIISRKEAKELNLSTYYTGKPCKYGHRSERYTSNCYCVTCCRNYQEQNKEILKEYNKNYRLENKEVLREKQKKYVENNKIILQERIKERNKNPEYIKRAKERYLKYKERNLERIRETARKSGAKYRDKNREKINTKSRLRYKNPSEKSKKKEYNKTWIKNNKDKIGFYNHNRRSKLLERLPVWFSEFDEFVITEANNLRSLREITSNIQWEIDHLFPLAGKKVSGLHVGLNLQVIPMTLNRRKSNSMLYTEIAEYVRDL